MKYFCALLLFCMPLCAGAQYRPDSAEVYLNNGEYEQFLAIIKATINYNNSLPAGCGNAAEGRREHIIKLMAMYYDKIGKTDTAIQMLLPITVNRGLMGENIYLFKILKSILLHKYTVKQIRNEIIKATNTITKDKSSDSHYTIQLFGHSHTFYTMWNDEFLYYKLGANVITEKQIDSIYNLQIIIPDAEMKPMMKKMYQQSNFYQTFTSLRP